MEAKPWRDAVGDARDDAVEITERSARAVGEFGARTFESTKTRAEKAIGAVADRLRHSAEASEDKTDVGG